MQLFALAHEDSLYGALIRLNKKRNQAGCRRKMIDKIQRTRQRAGKHAEEENFIVIRILCKNCLCIKKLFVILQPEMYSFDLEEENKINI